MIVFTFPLRLSDFKGIKLARLKWEKE